MIDDMDDDQRVQSCVWRATALASATGMAIRSILLKRRNEKRHKDTDNSPVT
jgi:hypothetical protein